MRALNLAKEIKTLELIKSANQTLSEVYETTGRNKEALASYKEYVAGRDSLLNAENTKKTVQTQMQYEFDKKESATKLEQEKRDAIATAESRKQKIIIYAVSAGLFLYLFWLLLYFAVCVLIKERIVLSVYKKKPLKNKKN